jgi:hypothetical protein
MTKAREVIAKFTVQCGHRNNHLGPDTASRLLSDLSEAGFVILPKEQTKMMLSRGALYHIQGAGGATQVDVDLAKASYRAMRDAYLKGEGE